MTPFPRPAGTTRQLSCKKCGQIHMGVTRSYAEAQVATFNAYFDTLSPDLQQRDYGGMKSSIDRYSQCCGCGAPHTNMRPTRDDEGDSGITIRALIDEIAD